MLRRPSTPLVALSSLFILAGGFIHLREWLDGYRDVAAPVAGWWVVAVGFPVNAATSVLLVIALVASALRFRRFLTATVIAALLFQAGSLFALIQTRTGSLFGWSEMIWDDAANQTRAVEIGAMLMLAATLAVLASKGRLSSPFDRRAAQPSAA